MHLSARVAAWVALLASHVVLAAPAVEVHTLRITGIVSYRCYGGYDGKRRTDERTKAPCDNRETKETVIDEVLSPTAVVIAGSDAGGDITPWQVIGDG